MCERESHFNQINTFSFIPRFVRGSQWWVKLFVSHRYLSVGECLISRFLVELQRRQQGVSDITQNAARGQCLLCVDVVRDALTFHYLIGWISALRRAKDCGLETVECKWLFTGNKHSGLLRQKLFMKYNQAKNTQTHTWLTAVPRQPEWIWLAEAAIVTYISHALCLLVILAIFSWASLAFVCLSLQYFIYSVCVWMCLMLFSLRFLHKPLVRVSV